ncbi:Ankyrin repeat domain-containing protein [Tetrabaena socialis]|uniref:Ankyrin repeat domain-containing protein n=1 Tax=Tetrabaena socialis TaxID=47790 RepID=A0A2J8AI82_9CHLO|nr:Ankyrin repeat domain-containing protein [Tetrabaena socialis]|eukprot:PNH12224.1 Ankyrin repeat domain-containing protein [Tetrabaena socialis]
MNGSKEVVEALLRGRADVAAKSNDGRTALHWASWNGSKEVVKALLQAGANVAAKSNVGRTALHYASQEGRKVVEALLRAGADVAAKDNIGWTALPLASWNGRKEVVEALLRAGANVAARTNDNRTALHCAGHKEVVEALLRRGADVAAKANEVVEALLRAGADVAAKANDASTQLKASVPSLLVAVVQFSNDVRVEAALAEADLEALGKVTREMVRMNGGTNMAVAVQKAGGLLKRDALPGAMRHVVLLTDGRVDSYQAHEARQMAEQLADEQRHVSLFAYGVGRGVDRAELLHVIGGPPTCAAVSPHAAAAAAAAAAVGKTPLDLAKGYRKAEVAALLQERGRK